MIEGLLKKEKKKKRDINRINLKTKGRMVILSYEDIVGINDEECRLMFEMEK